MLFAVVACAKYFDQLLELSDSYHPMREKVVHAMACSSILRLLFYSFARSTWSHHLGDATFSYNCDIRMVGYWIACKGLDLWLADGQWIASGQLVSVTKV